MTMRIRWLASLVAIGVMLSCSAAFAQGYKEEDPTPPDAKREVLSLKAEVLPLRPMVLQLVAVVLPIAGAVTPFIYPDPLKATLIELGARVTDKQIRITLPADVLFDADKADLRPQADVPLGKVAAVINGNPQAAVSIEAHADSQGNDATAQRLSERRADAVRRWLAGRQVTTRMTTRGWGRKKPAAPNDDADGRKKNRRVEITIRTP
jgi:outer membrane protein OmpA-like peptidoglycan-associated protein